MSIDKITFFCPPYHYCNGLSFFFNCISSQKTKSMYICKKKKQTTTTTTTSVKYFYIIVVTKPKVGSSATKKFSSFSLILSFAFFKSGFEKFSPKRRHNLYYFRLFYIHSLQTPHAAGWEHKAGFTKPNPHQTGFPLRFSDAPAVQLQRLPTQAETIIAENLSSTFEPDSTF